MICGAPSQLDFLRPRNLQTRSQSPGRSSRSPAGPQIPWVACPRGVVARHAETRPSGLRSSAEMNCFSTTLARPGGTAQIAAQTSSCQPSGTLSTAIAIANAPNAEAAGPSPPRRVGCSSGGPPPCRPGPSPARAAPTSQVPSSRQRSRRRSHRCPSSACRAIGSRSGCASGSRSSPAGRSRRPDRLWWGRFISFTVK